MSFHASYFWLSVLSGGRKARFPSRSESPATAAAVTAEDVHDGNLCCHVDVIAKDGAGACPAAATTFVSGGDGWKWSCVRPFSAVITADDEGSMTESAVSAQKLK